MKNILFLLFLISTHVVYGQSALQLQVDDTNHIAIPYAGISLLSSRDSAIVQYGFADKTGNYSFLNIPNGSFIIAVKALGFTNSYQNRQFHSDTIRLRFSLRPSSKTLQEVIVNTHAPISTHGDTTSYNVKSFLQGNEVTVEDMLKKLPGISVSKDGTIKYKNKEIEKLMVEGDDFFEKGYRLLSKNMPVKPVEKVEALSHYSSNKLLKGIENSEKVALNLKLSENAKRTWFGDMTAWGELEKRKNYKLSSNLMNFSKKTKYYFLTNWNNVGEDPYGLQTFSPSMGGNELLGTDKSISSLMSMGAYSSNFDTKKSNFNNTKLISLNAIFHPSKRIKLKPLVYVDWDKNSYYQSSVDSFRVVGTAFKNEMASQLFKRKLQGLGQLDFDYDISDKQAFKAILTYDYNRHRDTSQNRFNGDALTENLATNNKKFNAQFSYTHKLTPRSALLLSGTYLHQTESQNYATNTFLLGNLFPDYQHVNALFQPIQNTMNYAGIRAKYYKRFATGNLIESSMGIEDTRSAIRSYVQVDTGSNLLQTTNLLFNDAHINQQESYWKNALTLKKGKWTLTSNLNLYARQLSIDTTHKQSKTWWNVNPNANLYWRLNPLHAFTWRYTFNNSNLNTLNLVPNYYLTDYRSMNRGLSSLIQLSTQSYAFQYSVGNLGTQFLGNVNVDYSYDKNYMSSQSVVQQDYTLTNAAVLHGSKRWSYSSDANYFLNAISSNVKANFSYSWYQYQNYVNSADLRNVTMQNYMAGLDLRSSSQHWLNYAIGYQWKKANYRIAMTQNRNISSQYYLNLYFRPNDKIDFQSNTDGYYFNALKGKKDYYFWDITGRYNFKPNKLTFQIEFRNLLNTHQFQNYYVTDTYISSQSYRLLPRMLLLGIHYNF